MRHPAFFNLDHIVYATPDFDSTVRRIESVFGVKASAGGQHRAWGTKNALLSLGPRIYLEIMGPGDVPPESGQPRPFHLDTLVGPRLVAWVARNGNLPSVVTTAQRNGLDLGEILHGSRQRLDGSWLKWTMTDLQKDREGGVVPYFIDWADSPHPAESATKGCSLVALRVYHPEAERIQATLAALGLDCEVLHGHKAMLEAVIDTPQGGFELA
jgi:hypothetical protein